ncbi:MAG TPA: histidine--tRNA ligase [Ferruginibacter sp.]|nr:histidine--tRNA ligase [Ferruginibacter sp.]HRN79673.1 histidine--tRNA ligase [Ferruginibacter sp.]HRO17586.1 histidine--tRNA ligase [Ferruginibacter sp.]HRQ21558.1 histidine--tRNA ligase [Ferruginibacter sp.]
MIKPGIPQGTRDFTSAVVLKRLYILNTIRRHFEVTGYEPLETPAMELLETLTGKYGDEGDQLIFKILNNGLSDAANIEKAQAGFQKILEGKNSEDITSRALRYDLTIPFARYVAMNRGTLHFPFKRYQMQPVWRADRPQKGRYREFTQCDADVVGSNSLWNEVELVHLYRNTFDTLGLKDAEITLNNRKLLAALALKCGAASMLTSITIAIDKLDKIGIDKVMESLKESGLTSEQVQTIHTYLSISGSNREKINQISNLLQGIHEAEKGIEELEFILNRVPDHYVHLDFKLARGLDYYTGTIYEVKAPQTVKMGSIGGGGRYDNLTGLFGVEGISGVGISFGVDRIYDVMDTLNLFPNDLNTNLKVLFFNMGDEESVHAFEICTAVQQSGIPSMLFPDSVKLDKQFKYAQKRNIPYIVIVGSEEVIHKKVVIKHLNTGNQYTLNANELISHLQNQIK